MRTLAEKEGRQLQALVDEAFADLIEKHKNAKPRAHVMGLPRQPQRVWSAYRLPFHLIVG